MFLIERHRAVQPEEKRLVKNLRQLFVISLLVASFLAIFKFVVDDEPPAGFSPNVERVDGSYQLKWSMPRLVQRPIRDYGFVSSTNITE